MKPTEIRVSLAILKLDRVAQFCQHNNLLRFLIEGECPGGVGDWAEGRANLDPVDIASAGTLRP